MGQSTSLLRPEEGSLPADLKPTCCWWNEVPKAGFEILNAAGASFCKACKITLDACYTPTILQVLNSPLDKLDSIKPLRRLKEKIKKFRTKPFESLKSAKKTLKLKKNRAVNWFKIILNLVEGKMQNAKVITSECQDVLAPWCLDGPTAGL